MESDYRVCVGRLSHVNDLLFELCVVCVLLCVWSLQWMWALIYQSDVMYLVTQLCAQMLVNEIFNRHFVV